MMRQLKKWISKRCCEFRFNGKAFDRFATRHLNIKRDDQAFKHRTQGVLCAVDPNFLSQFFDFWKLVVMAELGAYSQFGSNEGQVCSVTGCWQAAALLQFRYRA